MTISNLLTLQLPLGRTIFLAWLTATFVYIYWGLPVNLIDASPVETALQAGIFYAYYICIATVAYFGVAVPLVLVSVALSIALSVIPVFFGNRESSRLNRARNNTQQPAPDRSQVVARDVSDKARVNKFGFVSALRDKIGDLIAPEGDLVRFISMVYDAWSERSIRMASQSIPRNGAQVAAMFVGFLFYSNELVSMLAPIGLIILLFMFIIGVYDE